MLLDEVFLNLLSHTNDVSDAGLLQLPEVLLAGGSVGAEVEAGDDLLHVSPHGVGPVVHRTNHEAISLNVNILILTTFLIHLYQDIHSGHYNVSGLVLLWFRYVWHWLFLVVEW